MKLKITLKSISLATLMFAASAAQAQTSVTIYGAIDSGLYYQNTSAASFSPLAKNTGSTFRYKDAGIYGSVWGMRGNEDLGGGYRANFQLQGSYDSGSGKMGLSDTPGAAAIFNQISTVGISGPFGGVSIGRQVTPMIYAMVETDVRAGQYFGSILTAWIGMNTAAGWPGSSTNGPIGAMWDSNAIVYQSPNFGGVTLGLEYAPGEVSGNNQAARRESAVLKYANGGLHLSALYYDGHDTNPATGIAATGVDNNRLVYLGALYNIAGFSASGSVSNGKNPSNSSKTNIDMYSVGLGYRFTPVFKISSGLYYLKDANNSVNKSTTLALGAEYQLSKRTTLYAQAGKVSNKGTMTQAIGYGQPVAPGMDTTAVMTGIRHTF
ncbi:porin [Glaciimonas sp. GG7]